MKLNYKLHTKILNVLLTPRKTLFFCFGIFGWWGFLGGFVFFGFFLVFFSGFVDSLNYLQLHPTQVISRGNLYSDVIHLKISAYISNEIKQGNLKVLSFESKQELTVNALQKKGSQAGETEELNRQTQDLLIQRAAENTGFQSSRGESCY